MTSGCLIFAFNNSVIDYAAMADWSAANIHRHLDLPVCIATDMPKDRFKNADCVVQISNQHANMRAMDDFGGIVDWHNMNRMDALYVTPWDHTILLDADYVVASPQLKVLLDCPDFLCHDLARDITGNKPDRDINVFGSMKLPMLWATVLSFRKTQQTQDIFALMQLIRDNWKHYCDLFGIRGSPYRNDFALSIAALVVNGHRLFEQTIPWPLMTVTQDHVLSKIEQDLYRVEFTNSNGQSHWITVPQQDFHAMGKKLLGGIVADQT